MSLGLAALYAAEILVTGPTLVYGVIPQFGPVEASAGDEEVAAVGERGGHPIEIPFVIETRPFDELLVFGLNRHLRLVEQARCPQTREVDAHRQSLFRREARQQNTLIVEAPGSVKLKPA